MMPNVELDVRPDVPNSILLMLVEMFGVVIYRFDR